MSTLFEWKKGWKWTKLWPRNLKKGHQFLHKTKTEFLKIKKKGREVEITSPKSSVEKNVMVGVEHEAYEKLSHISEE
jgi:hypothetical protein